MNNTHENTVATAEVISSTSLLEHWQGHRALTRRVIEAFPEEEFTSYSIGGMRTFAELCQELLAIAEPGIKEIATNTTQELDEKKQEKLSKEQVLQLWDKATEEINSYWSMIPTSKFQEKIMCFGMYEGTVCSSIFYFIDNEIHHRGQAYVYLRALGIEPPAFWER